VNIQIVGGSCTALVRPAVLVSLWERPILNIVVSSSVVVPWDGEDVLVVLGFREALPSDIHAVMSTEDVEFVPLSVDAQATLPSTLISDLCARRGCRPDFIGKIVFKSQPIPFKNGNGEMIAFVFEDASGKIRAVSFSPDCHSLDARLQEGCRYRITGGRCKKSDSRFSEAAHAYELVLDVGVVIGVA
jgi:hypothetical protein